MVERIKRVLSIADRKVSAQLRRSKPVVRDRFDYEIATTFSRFNETHRSPNERGVRQSAFGSLGIVRLNSRAVPTCTPVIHLHFHRAAADAALASRSSARASACKLAKPAHPPTVLNRTAHYVDGRLYRPAASET
jgi:hypothetical protein